jgi:hypothetical protein
MSARFIPAGAIALLCVVSSAESQSFQPIALTSCRLPGVDGEARCGSYEVYELAPGLALGVFKEGESLFGQTAGQPKFELHPESEVVFFLKEPPALFLFIRNDKGQVAQMLYIQDGRVTAAKKIK